MADASTDPGEPTGSAPSSSRRGLLTIGVLVVLAALVAGGIWYQTSRSDNPPTADVLDLDDVPTAARDEGMAFASGAGPIIDIYLDYQCIHCADLEEVIGTELAEMVAADQVELVLRPVKFLSRASGRGAAALYCAADVGRAYDMHTRLLSDISANFSPEGLTSIAADLGLDPDTFGACLADDATTDWVNAVTDSAVSDGIQGTPAVFVDGTRLSDAQLASGPAFRTAVLADGS